ncbi:DUF3857 domain-containing protein [Chitinophaga barathri]|uniref:DUF3857 domain-containing protein n=1 Tax=Chitinophaga barathri TaxID=1647451 RepID=A0A3N4MMI2_9BACT|nr:DUF3857 domain-containing protein [Chitinophaga barathri]RPD43266.1 DUF3857 domain-containing protein [Chitinophaga barathri]
MRLTALLLLISVTALAGDPEYPVSAIPPALLKNADVVQRLEEVTMKLHDIKDVRLTHRIVMTILNEKGEKYSGFSTWYDKERSITEFRGALYDASGKQLRKLKQSEVRDASGVSDNNLYDDSRVKSHDFYYKVYPYTIEYEVEYRERGSANFAPWVPQGTDNYAVEQSRLSVTVPADYDLRYRQFNYNGQPLQVPGKGDKTFVWEVKDIPAQKAETLASPWRTRSVMVYLAPSDFAYGSYTGKMKTWEDFGTFLGVLNGGRDVLPDKIKTTVHQLTDNVQDPREKVRVLYEYMQQNTRYISVQLGIGGWQTFDAAYVANNRYGDCKALSNYMFSLLKEAGIRSHCALVKAGEGETDFIEDFAANQFNHMILCVPMAKDTVWLECTSQIQPAGYLGDFTDGRPVLLVTENGGKLVRTPVYTLDQNLRAGKVKATVDEDGNLTGTSATLFTGPRQDWYHSLITSVSAEKQLDILKEKLNLSSYDIRKFHYTPHPQARPVPEMTEDLEITVPNYASVSGKRFFIVPNVLNRNTLKLTQDEARKADIWLRTPTRDVDTVEILIPNGYTPESVFQPVKVESRFGMYQASVKVEGNKITYFRTLELRAGQYPAKDYSALEEFLNMIYKTDRNRVILVKKEA